MRISGRSRMSKTIFGGSVLIAAIALMVQATDAQTNKNSTVGFQNKSKTIVKVCIYAGAAEQYPIALKCMTLKPGEKQVWNRGQVPVLSVVAYDPGLIDVARCSQVAILDPAFIEIFDKRSKNCIQATDRVKIVPGPNPVKPPVSTSKNTLRVCNLSIDEPVYFAITFALGQTNYFTEGWWRLIKNGCMDIDLEERWRKQGLPTNIRYKTHIYGETAGTFAGVVKKVWEGDDPKFAFCISDNKEVFFGNKHQDVDAGVVWESDCAAAAGKRTVKMWPIEVPKTGGQWKWNF